MRGGSQLSLQSAELQRPLIGLLFRSIDVAIQRYIIGLSAGTDPLRMRNTGRAALTGAWSVRQRSGGHHVDHVHRTEGYRLGYIALPYHWRRPDSRRLARFGRPGVKTLPVLMLITLAATADRDPVSRNMWHGVEPFEAITARVRGFDLYLLCTASRALHSS